MASSAAATLPAAELARGYHRNGQDRNPGRKDRLPEPHRQRAGMRTRALPLPSITLAHVLTGLQS